MTQVMLQISKENQAEAHLQLRALSGLALAPAPFVSPHSLSPEITCLSIPVSDSACRELGQSYMLFFHFSLSHFREGQL